MKTKPVPVELPVELPADLNINLVNVPKNPAPPVYVVELAPMPRRSSDGPIVHRLAPWGDPERASTSPPKSNPARAAAMVRSVRVVLPADASRALHLGGAW